MQGKCNICGMEYVEEQNVPQARYLITGRNFLSWMPKTDRLNLLANKPTGSTKVGTVSGSDVEESRDIIKKSKKVDRDQSLRKKLIANVKERELANI